MPNFAGYMPGYEPTEEDKQWDFVRSLQDKDFRAKDNNFIKKEKKRLSEVAATLTDPMIDKETRVETANDMLQDLFNMYGYDPQGKDNEFCYTLGDKIMIFIGEQPHPQYESDMDDNAVV